MKKLSSILKYASILLTIYLFASCAQSRSLDRHYKTGANADDYLISRLECASVDGGRMVFGMNAGGGAVNSWVLKIETHGGNSIKTFSGGNVLPSSVLWDGLSSEGNELEDDIVYVKLVVRGEKKVIESKMMSVEIVNGHPIPKKDL